MDEEDRLNAALLVAKDELRTLVGMRDDAILSSKQATTEQARSDWLAAGSSLSDPISEKRREIAKLENERENLRGRDPFD